MRKILVLIMFFIGSLHYCYSENLESLKQKISTKYSDCIPKKWSDTIDGIMTKLDTNEKVIALTLDACGSKNNSYDSKLIYSLNWNTNCKLTRL